MRNAAVPLNAESRMGGATAKLRLVEPALTAVGQASFQGRSCSFFTPTKLEAFVAVVEEG